MYLFIACQNNIIKIYKYLKINDCLLKRRLVVNVGRKAIVNLV